MRTAPRRTSAIAVVYGALPGVIAALTLKVMLWLQKLVWGVSDASWYLVVAILVGAALGVATVAIVPGLQVTGALVAGLAAATAVGLRKPAAALLIGLFVVQGTALGPLVVGVAVGVLVLKLLGRREAPDRTEHVAT